jgi:hypothetical protein
MGTRRHLAVHALLRRTLVIDSGVVLAAAAAGDPSADGVTVRRRSSTDMIAAQFRLIHLPPQLRAC